MSEAKKIDGSVYSSLTGINVNEHTEKKGNLTYLTWAWAWAEVLGCFPEATYDMRSIPMEIFDDGTVIVWGSVTIEGITREMWLPVMDNRNNAISNPDARKIQDCRMRCLVKCIAMHGLGLYIYAGEDIPGEASTGKSVDKSAAKLKKLKENAIKRLNELDYDSIAQAFTEAGIETKDGDKGTLSVPQLLSTITTEKQLREIGSRAVELHKEASEADQRPEDEKAEDPNPTDDKQDAKEAEQADDIAKANKKKADAKIAKAEKAKKAKEAKAKKEDPEPAADAPSDEDPTADDSFIEAEGPDADIKAVMPASHKPKPDEIADETYVDFVVDYFRKMIEQTLTHEILAEYVEAKVDEWDKAALDKLFGLYKQLNEGTSTLSDAFPKHYEG